MRKATLTFIILAALADLRSRLCRPLRSSTAARSYACTPSLHCAATTQQSPSHISTCRHSRCASSARRRISAGRCPGRRFATSAAPGTGCCRPLSSAVSIRSSCGSARLAGLALRALAPARVRPRHTVQTLVQHPRRRGSWWVQTLPLHARLVAMKRWPQPAFDLRDHRRHQLLVIAYTLAGQRAVDDRLGSSSRQFATASTAPGGYSKRLSRPRSIASATKPSGPVRLLRASGTRQTKPARSACDGQLESVEL